MITNFEIFEMNHASNSMWAKYTNDSSSPTHHLKPSMLKKGVYVVEYREKYFDGLFLLCLGLNSGGGTTRFPYYDFKVMGEINWHNKNEFLRSGKNWISYGPEKELDTVLYIGEDLEEAKKAFRRAKEIVSKLKVTQRFDL